MERLIRIHFISVNLVVLIDAHFGLNLKWLVPVFKTEQSGVDLKLCFACRSHASLEIVHTKKVSSERYAVGRTKAVWRIIQRLLWCHLVADAVIHISI